MAQEMCVEMEGAQEFGLCGREMGVLLLCAEIHIIRRRNIDVLAAVSLWLVHQSECRFESTEAR